MQSLLMSINKEVLNMEHADAIAGCEFTDEDVNKVNYVKTEQLGTDTYYFKPGQILAYHRHPEGDQVFFVQEGEGEFYLDAGTEEKVDIKVGSIVLAPKNVWHKVVNTGSSRLIVSQATRQPAGMEKR